MNNYQDPLYQGADQHNVGFQPDYGRSLSNPGYGSRPLYSPDAAAGVQMNYQEAGFGNNYQGSVNQ